MQINLFEKQMMIKLKKIKNVIFEKTTDVENNNNADKETLIRKSILVSFFYLG